MDSQGGQLLLRKQLDDLRVIPVTQDRMVNFSQGDESAARTAREQVPHDNGVQPRMKAPCQKPVEQLSGDVRHAFLLGKFKIAAIKLRPCPPGPRGLSMEGRLRASPLP